MLLETTWVAQSIICIRKLTKTGVRRFLGPAYKDNCFFFCFCGWKRKVQFQSLFQLFRDTLSSPPSTFIPSLYNSLKQILYTLLNSIFLDLISAIFSGENLLMTSFSLAGRPRLKTSCSNTGKLWNLITCHRTYTTGLIWYSATNKRDPLQLRHWMSFTTVLMKVCENTVNNWVLRVSQGISRRPLCYVFVFFLVLWAS